MMKMSEVYIEVFEQKLLSPVVNKKILNALYFVTLVLFGSFLIALSSKIKISLPFTPVPVTMQTFTVLYLSIMLGRYRSLAVMCAYILNGVIGLPMFAGGSGLAYLLGPTGGYILGFLFAGYVVGWLAELGMDRKFFSAVIVMLVGNLIIYIFGILWLMKVLQISFDRAIVLGVIPFLPGDGIKILLAGILLPTGWKLIKKFNILS